MPSIRILKLTLHIKHRQFRNKEKNNRLGQTILSKIEDTFKTLIFP